MASATHPPPRREGTSQVRDAPLINQFWASTIDGLTQGAIYALVALGYTLVYGVLRLINFAHSEIFMLGTFATVVRSSQWLGVDRAPQTGVALSALLLLLAGGRWPPRGGAAVAARAHRLPTAAPAQRAPPGRADHRDRCLAVLQQLFALRYRAVTASARPHHGQDEAVRPLRRGDPHRQGRSSSSAPS